MPIASLTQRLTSENTSYRNTFEKMQRRLISQDSQAFSIVLTVRSKHIKLRLQGLQR